MQFTFFSFVMSLMWFNLYMMIINFFRKNDDFIISFSTLPIMFFLFLSIFRLIFNFEIPGSIVIESKTIFPKAYNFIRTPLNLEGFSINIFKIFIFIWVIVAIILLINSIVKYRKFKKSLGKLDKSRNKENEQIFNKILNLKEMNKKIKIIQHDNISSPFILGILNGKLYIPNINFSEEELEYIISHEINHFREKDFLKKILIQSIKYIFWWNPFAYLFANNFNHILEIQCDLKTTADFAKDKKIKYLESITKIINNEINYISKNFSHSTVPNFIEIKELTSLKQRFRIILNYKSKQNIFKLLSIGLCTLGLTINIFSYFIIIQPHYLPDEENSFLTSKELKFEQENKFIIKNEKGQYKLYENNVFQYIINDINKEEFKDVPVY